MDLDPRGARCAPHIVWGPSLFYRSTVILSLYSIRLPRETYFVYVCIDCIQPSEYMRIAESISFGARERWCEGQTDSGAVLPKIGIKAFFAKKIV